MGLVTNVEGLVQGLWEKDRARSVGEGPCQECGRRTMTGGESQGEIVVPGGVQEGRGGGMSSYRFVQGWSSSQEMSSSQAGKTSQR